jgi:hypothetical protein
LGDYMTCRTLPLAITGPSGERQQKAIAKYWTFDFRFRGRAYFTEKLSYSAARRPFCSARSLLSLLRFLLSFICSLRN